MEAIKVGYSMRTGDAFQVEKDPNIYTVEDVWCVPGGDDRVVVSTVENGRAMQFDIGIEAIIRAGGTFVSMRDRGVAA